MGLHQIPLAVQAVPGPIFLIPEELQEKHGYPDLTKNLKANVFGLNAAKVFRVDVDAKRKALPKDYLSHIKMAYLEEGPSPTHHAYGWVATKYSNNMRPF